MKNSMLLKGLLPLLLAGALTGCNSTLETPNGPGSDPSGENGGEDPGDSPIDEPEPDEWEQRLDEREYDYSAALRTASLRLRGTLPTVAEIESMTTAADPAVAYEALIAQFLEDPRLSRQLLSFWRLSAVRRPPWPIWV